MKKIIIVISITFTVTALSFPKHDRWMENNEEYISNVPISKVFIPGSHDSGTYAITAGSKLCAAEITKWAKLASNIVARLSRTQNLNYIQQIHSGIRYFDIRVCKHNNSMWTSHGMVSYPLISQLKEMLPFINSHPKEVIILHFQKFHGFTSKDHGKLQEDILNLFKSKIASKNKLNASSKMKDFWSANKNIIIIYSDSKSIKNNIQNFFWPWHRLSNPWPNKNRVNEAFTYLDNAIERRNMGRLFVTQAILTPKAENFMRSVEFLADKINKQLETKIEHEWSKKSPNIIMIDYVEQYDVISSIIEQNKNN